MKIDNQFLLLLLFWAPASNTTQLFFGNVIIVAVGRTHIKIRVDTGLSLSTVLVRCCLCFRKFYEKEMNDLSILRFLEGLLSPTKCSCHFVVTI
jgi:hypothetical protein